MARTNDFSRVLWLVTTAWLAGCGRIGFGESDHDSTNQLPDAPEVDGPVIKGPPVVTVTAPSGLQSVCGEGVTLSAVTVTNSGETALVITDLATRDGVFQVTTDAPVTVAPGGSAEIQIKVPAAVIGTDIGGRSKTDQLMIAANVPIAPVDLSTKVMGANIQVVTPPPPSQLLFNGTSGACPLPRAVTLRNAGNVEATVTTKVPAAFRVSGTSSASVSGGASMAFTLRPFTTSACSGTGLVQYTISGPNCGASGMDGPSLGAQFTISGASTCFCS